jgi:hypothetical protein
MSISRPKKSLIYQIQIVQRIMTASVSLCHGFLTLDFPSDTSCLTWGTQT